ncbi:MAG: hypothetical protein A2Y88_03510 [Chloroflexi bacterium RBG_13_48_10]|jgi:hypothetical protein|nr:MAG: hypothetical protein A2Y88_03510 [Chloroflexi bacterium RBG_13_48_10]
MLINEDSPGAVSLFNIPSKMKMIGCKESFVEFFIDPGIAKQYVPVGYDVRKYPNAKAVLLIMIQDWDKCILDGFLPVRRVKMSHVWIELNGPNEIGPALPGTDSSLPTSYYYAFPHQIDNKLAFLAFRLVGMDVQLVARIETAGKPGDHSIVRVIERENPTIGYSWEAHGSLWSAPKILTGRRWFYRKYGKRLKRKSKGLVICRSSFMGDGTVQMSVDERSILGSLGFDSKLSGELKYVQTDCNCRIRVGK